MKVEHTWWKTFFDEDYIRFWTGLSNERTITECNSIEKMLGINQRSKILDVPSGQGRISRELAKRGYFITAFDYSEYMLNKVTENFNSPNLSTYRGDMRDFHMPNTYDGVISVFSPLGYFQDKQQDIKFLMCVFNSLKTGGKFVIDSRHRDYLATKTPSNEYWEYEEGLLLESWKFDATTGIRSASLKWLENGKWYEKNSASLYYTATEIIEMLNYVGFEINNIYGGYDFSSFQSSSPSIVIEAVKS